MLLKIYIESDRQLVYKVKTLLISIKNFSSLYLRLLQVRCFQTRRFSALLTDG